MRALVTALCLLTATACDEKSPTGPTVGLSQEFTLARGQAAAIEGTQIRLQFIEVTGDSRCPADALCIQGGDAIVHVRAFESGSTADLELHTGDSSRATVTFRRFRVQLMQLQPYPFSSRTIAPDDYRATLTVTTP